ncbi:MAG: 16S rRNA (cytosine(1402)-N(4))-methyltransferase RsmH [Bacteroidales bacterium]|nr:16S rRNA (cytosine(1402)-N(4))-methyltransferase RsmH [Bacteroidales bacterium]
MSEYHTPVLLEESVSALVGNADGIYADATFGGGGHSREILSRLASGGRLIAFDRDAEACTNAVNDKRFTLIRNNFRFINNFAMQLGVHFDGILADLGVSSHQFDTAERGFSFRFDAPLDMRMNPDGEKTAADIVNSYGQDELERVLRLYGEVEKSHKVAELIAAARTVRPIRTTVELNAAIEAVIPPFAEHKYLARVYQALRIEVNEEMRSLEKFLEGAKDCLKSGGRLAVITYHSLEDRMVKNFIRCGNVEGKEESDIYGRVTPPLKAVNRKPVLPGESEIAANTRARSAKLRIAEKI